LEKEILFQSDLERLIGKRPFAHQTTYEKFTNGTPTPEKKEAEAGSVNGAAEPAQEPSTVPK
jgi:cell division protease FtsH